MQKTHSPCCRGWWLQGRRRPETPGPVFEPCQGLPWANRGLVTTWSMFADASIGYVDGCKRPGTQGEMSFPFRQRVLVRCAIQVLNELSWQQYVRVSGTVMISNLPPVAYARRRPYGVTWDAVPKQSLLIMPLRLRSNASLSSRPCQVPSLPLPVASIGHVTTQSMSPQRRLGHSATLGRCWVTVQWPAAW